MTTLARIKCLQRLLIVGMIFLFFIWALFSISYGERIIAGGGLGWDGVKYVNYAKNFHEFIFRHQLSYYASQRIFPAYLVHLVAKFLHIRITQQSAPVLFSLLNAVMLMFSVMIWMKLAKKLQWSFSVQIISFAGLFLNYANLKLAFYYPTLTDTTAFTLGMLMLYSYLSESKKILLLTAVIGAFTFPTLLYAGLILFLFGAKEEFRITEAKANIAFVIMQAIMITSLFVFLWYENNWFGAARAVGANYSLPVLCVSSLAVFLYSLTSLYLLSKYYKSILVNFKNITTLKKILSAILVYVFLNLSIHWIASSDISSELTTSDYIIHIAGQALAYPFNFIFSHVIYYGPIVCLFIMLFKAVVQQLVDSRSIGLFLLTGLYVLLFMGSESRQLINFLPMLVYMVANVLNKKEVPLNFAVIFAFLSLCVSKFWLPINFGSEWPSLLTSPADMTLQFPLQWYFMSQGPWVSPNMYIVNAIIFVGVFLTLKHIRNKYLINENLNQTNVFYRLNSAAENSSKPMTLNDSEALRIKL